MNSRRAFTLIELIVVIAIIAVLASMILVGVQKVRAAADATKSAANIRSLAAANISYLADNGRYAPADDQKNNRRWHGARSSASAKFDATRGFLSPYLGKTRQVVECPAFAKMRKASGSFEEGSGGYGYNASYIGGTPAWRWEKSGERVSAVGPAVERLTTTVMFASTAYARDESVQEYPYCEPPFWDFGNGPSGARPSPSVHFRFDGKALVAWCDGRVSFEPRVKRDEGENPHGGDAAANDLGWFGPDEENGYWNPVRSYECEPLR